MKKYFALIFLLSFCFLQAQENLGSGTWLSGGGHYGFIIPHTENLLYLTNGHTYGGEISLSKTTSGCKQWQCDFNYPEIGANLFYVYLSNPSQLGFGMTANPFINFPIVKRKRFAFNCRTALSIGYLSRTFDRVSNFKNGAIGSHFNSYVHIRFNAYNRINKNFRLEYGLSLSHFSNGAYKMPNLGINVPTLHLGIGYCIAQKDPQINLSDTNSSEQKFQVVCYAGGFKAEVQPPLGTHYSAFTFSSTIDYLRSRKHRFILGAEVGYNGGNIERLDKNTTINNKSELLNEGIKFGYAFRIGALELPLEYGYYLHSITRNYTGSYFHRIGLRYYFPNNLIANFTLKTHWAVADYWECGIGYVFRKKSK